MSILVRTPRHGRTFANHKELMESVKDLHQWTFDDAVMFHWASVKRPAHPTSVNSKRTPLLQNKVAKVHNKMDSKYNIQYYLVICNYCINKYLTRFNI